MTAITWGDTGKRLYETGVDRGVFYPPSGAGVPWNGLTSVKDVTADGEQTVIYYDGVHVRNVVTLGDFQATIEAFTYPDEFIGYDGVSDGMLESQPRKPFGFAYRTLIGNDSDGNSHGYKIHLVYNATAEPTASEYQTLAQNPDIVAFSWGITTKPITVLGFRPTTHVVINSLDIYPSALANLELILYGTTGVDPAMPSLSDLLDIFASTDSVKITDNGDGTWTAEGPSEVITMLDANTFQIDWHTATYLDANTYTISSP